MTRSITVSDYRAMFHVETVHQQRLEFVLNGAEIRNKKYSDFYITKLHDALDDEFKTDNTLIAERETYGYISFVVIADTADELNKALERCSVVVQCWIDVYRINFMESV